MARGLTKKQRIFVNEYADTGNGTQSALKAYDTDTVDTASSIAWENLKKPEIIQALNDLGFNSNNAKRVVGEILNDGTAEKHNRLKAAEMIFKVHGDFAPEKHLNVNVEADLTQREEDYAERLLNAQRETPSH